MSIGRRASHRRRFGGRSRQPDGRQWSDIAPREPSQPLPSQPMLSQPVLLQLERVRAHVERRSEMLADLRSALVARGYLVSATDDPQGLDRLWIYPRSTPMRGAVIVTCAPGEDDSLAFCDAFGARLADDVEGAVAVVSELLAAEGARAR